MTESLDAKYTEDGIIVQPDIPAVDDCKTNKCKLCFGPYIGQIYDCDEPCKDTAPDPDDPGYNLRGEWQEWLPSAGTCWSPCESKGFIGGISREGATSASSSYFIGNSGDGMTVYFTIAADYWGGFVTVSLSGAASFQGTFDFDRFDPLNYPLGYNYSVFSIPVSGGGSIGVSISCSPSEITGSVTDFFNFDLRCGGFA